MLFEVVLVFRVGGLCTLMVIGQSTYGKYGKNNLRQEKGVDEMC